ncbi:MAG: hypothetical protein Q8882_00705 [Bacillota bacterium]|nr:hypothetical protein [Bacillota bacterium]
MESVLYSPPVLFTLILISLMVFSKWLSRFSSKKESGEHALDSYACGQRDVENYVNPDYSNYFSYAFIFTVVHILILVVATVPANVLFTPIIYIFSGILAIFIAFKR